MRAKTGRINGALVALLTVMKGLPLTYSKDMQEDKEAVFDAADSLELAILAAMTGMVGDLTVDAARMAAAAGSGYSTATDLADWLVREAGLPFREAHHVTGRAVALAETKRLRPRRTDARSNCSRSIRASPQSAFSVLSVQKSVESRTSFGGTAPANVAAQAAWWRDRLKDEAAR